MLRYYKNCKNMSLGTIPIFSVNMTTVLVTGLTGEAGLEGNCEIFPTSKIISVTKRTKMVTPLVGISIPFNKEKGYKKPEFTLLHRQFCNVIWIIFV